MTFCALTKVILKLELSPFITVTMMTNVQHIIMANTILGGGGGPY